MARPSSRRQLVSNEFRRGCSPSAGFAGTSLQDIADSMGVSRRNRDELLAALVHDVLDPTVRLLEEVAELMVELALSGVRRSDERSVDAGPFPPPLDPDTR